MYVSVSVRTFLLWVPENSAPSGISIVGSGARGVQGGKVVFRQGRLWALRGYHSGPGFSPSLNSVSFCDNSIFRLAYLMWPHNGGHTFDPHPWRCQSRKREDCTNNVTISLWPQLDMCPWSNESLKYRNAVFLPRRPIVGKKIVYHYII